MYVRRLDDWYTLQFSVLRSDRHDIKLTCVASLFRPTKVWLESKLKWNSGYQTKNLTTKLRFFEERAQRKHLPINSAWSLNWTEIENTLGLLITKLQDSLA